VVDVDKLKTVNDSLGHDAGDRLICSTANALVGSMRASDTVARTGGDEFIAVLKNVRDKAGLSRLCNVVSKALQAKAAEEMDTPSPLTCSIGVAVFPDDGALPSDILRQADAAMYRIKHAGGNGFAFA